MSVALTIAKATSDFVSGFNFFGAFFAAFFAVFLVAFFAVFFAAIILFGFGFSELDFLTPSKKEDLNAFPMD